jgi:hypothetical protein
MRTLAQALSHLLLLVGAVACFISVSKPSSGDDEPD